MFWDFFVVEFEHVLFPVMFSKATAQKIFEKQLYLNVYGFIQTFRSSSKSCEPHSKKFVQESVIDEVSICWSLFIKMSPGTDIFL